MSPKKNERQTENVKIEKILRSEKGREESRKSQTNVQKDTDRRRRLALKSNRENQCICSLDSISQIQKNVNRKTEKDNEEKDNVCLREGGEGYFREIMIR